MVCFDRAEQPHIRTPGPSRPGKGGAPFALFQDREGAVRRRGRISRDRRAETAACREEIRSPFAEYIKKLLSSRVHEHRLVALLILADKYKKADEEDRQRIAAFYLANTRHINNWDLVDLSAPHILGDYLLVGDRSVLYRLARSESLWERRIAIIATFTFIRKGDFEDTLRISEILLKDGHCLIHKAAGWMLREVGKRNLKTEEQFLKRHYRRMPRTMLRYAIERFDERRRKNFLKR